VSVGKESDAQHLRVRCPHCFHAIWVVAHQQWHHLRCDLCGKEFSVVDSGQAAPAEQRVGHFELIEKLGSGSFGSVWKARDTQLDRLVAVKVPRRGKLNPDDVERFIAEARVVARLKHPAIVHVYEIGRDGDDIYIVSDLIEGQPLHKKLEAGGVACREAAEICWRIAEALQHAHESQIVHRDIKPANILLVHPDKADGDIKVSDFGAALLAGTDITQVSGVGSPAYMSPQQVREMPLTHQTDIYSLGVVMYQLLTGRLPFNATNNYGMVHQITSAEAPAPSVFRRDIPASIEAIVARAMNKDLEQRYANWEEFSHDLAQAFRNRQLKERAQSIADSEKFQTLRRLPFFREFSDVEIWEVVRFSDWDEICPGTVIMKDGEPGDYFCFLAEGEVKVVKRGRLLSILNVGDCFGEMAVVTQTGGARGADIVAVTDSRIVTIRGRAIRQASEVCRMNFYRAFLEVIISRLSQANSRIAGEA
jgi:serine/threonine protein kinase